MDANLNLQARRPEPVNVAQMSVPDKLTQAMQQSVGKLPGELQQQMQQLLKPEALAVLGGVAATWGALQVAGGPFAVAADVALLGAGYAALGASAVTASQELFEFVRKASQAQTPQQLDQAASHFAKFVSIVGVDAVAALAGARAGRVAEDLGQLVKNSSARLGELTGETQRLAGTLVKGGNELWQSAGQRLGKVGDDLGRTLDNALEGLGIQRPQAATAGGPQLPANQPMQTQTQTGGSERIAANGAETVAAQVQRLEGQLVSRGINARNAHEIMELATGQPKVLQALEGLLNGRGNLRNPNELSKLVERATRDAEPGILRELELAAARVRQGHDVQLGTVKQPGVGKVGADVVDFTTQEAIHSKNITSPAQNAVEGEIDKSAQQFEGRQPNPEIVPTKADGQTFRRVTEVIVNNPQNPSHNQTPNQLAEFLQGQFKNNSTLRENVDAVRITNQSGVHEFKVIRSERTHEFQFVAPTTTQPRQVSQVETQGNQIAQQVPANVLASVPEQPTSIAEQIRANRERYPLPQPRTPQALDTTIADRNSLSQSPRESLESIKESNPSLHNTLSRLNNVIDKLDGQTLARQPQPSPAQRVYEKTAQGITQQTGLTPGHDRFEPVLAAKLLAEHGYHQAASIIAAGSPRLNEVNATFGSTTADRQLAELMKQGEQTLQAMRPEQQRQQDQMEQG
jgi:hypothetical protein